MSMHGAIEPVVGALQPYLSGVQSGFKKFDTGTVHGLAMVTDDRLDILALHTWHKSHGHGGRFLADCQRYYRTVGVWHVFNPILRAMLTRRGFIATTEHVDGDDTDGMIWRRRE